MPDDVRPPTSDDLVPLESPRLPDGVIDLAGFRVTRGMSQRSTIDRCHHRNLTYSTLERRVQCDDCKHNIDGFDAFMVLVGGFEEMQREARRRMREATSAKEHALVSRAAKAVDEVWRGRKMAPCCPHCGNGLLPEDFTSGGRRSVSREWELARRGRDRGDGK